MRDSMFTRRQGRPDRRWQGAMLALLVGLGATSPARAQFNFFGAREASPEDVSDTIAEHGFQLVGPLYRNGRVYLADVIDRRRHRERLVISAESGQIVQRFLVDVGPERQPPAYVSRSAPRDDSFFSHLTRGWDDEPPPRPPLGLDEPDRVPPPAVPRRRTQPRVVTRTEAPPAAVTTTPLPPSTAATPDPATAKPEVVSVPAPSATTAPSSVRGTSVSTDPLRIPGSRKPEEPKPAPAAVAASKAPDPTPPPAPAKAKPAPASADVPVAPLD